MWLFAPSEDPLKLLIQDNWDYFPSALGSNTQAQMQFPMTSYTNNTQQGQLQNRAHSLKEGRSDIADTAWDCPNPKRNSIGHPRVSLSHLPLNAGAFHIRRL